MVSKNQLLGFNNEVNTMEEKEKEKETNERIFLYHKDCIDGKIFDDLKSITKAIDDGWVESPALIVEEEEEEEEEEDLFKSLD